MEKIKHIALQSLREGRMKDLAGYDKRARNLDRTPQQRENSLKLLAEPELKADLEKRFTSLREVYEYRRKEMETTYGDGHGSIRTPDFEYTVTVAVEEDPDCFGWVREIHPLRDPECLKDARFQSVFGDLFDSLVCDFSEPADIAALVDTIEDTDPDNLSLDYDSACSYAEIRLQGFSGKVRVEPHHLTVHGGGAATPSALTAVLFDLKRYFDGDDRLLD